MKNLKQLIYTLAAMFLINGNITGSIADSLLNAVKHAPDTDKVHIYNKLSNIYHTRTPVKAREYNYKALTISQQNDFHKGIVRSYLLIGYSYYYHSNYDSAIYYYKKALDVSLKNNLIKQAATCYGSIGNSYNSTGMYSKALDNFEHALTKYTELQDSLGMSISLINIGNSFDFIGNYNKAQSSFMQSLAIAEQINNVEMIGSNLSNLSIIYKEQGDLENTLKYLLKAEELYKTHSSDQLSANIINNIGIYYQEINELDKALEYYKKALNIREKINDTQGKALAYNNVGVIYFKKENYTKAQEYFTKAFELAKASKNLQTQVYYQNNICNVFIKKYKFSKAIELAKNSLVIADSINTLPDIKESHNILSEAYQGINNFEKALFHHKKYTEVKDSIMNENSLKEIESLKAKYHADQREKELKLKEQKLEILSRDNKIGKIMQYAYISLAILISILGILIYSYQKTKLKKNKIINEKEKALMQAELKNIEYDKQTLQAELEYKNKEIVNFALHIVEKNDFLDKLKKSIEDTTGNDKNKELKSLIDENLSIERDREEFKANVEQVHASFFHNLTEKFPALTKNEKRLCALLRLNLSSKEIATILNISPSSVDMNRHRLRKKIELPSEHNLTDFFNSL